ncbi:3,4-dihydroxy-2-butanone-4-phosphate synthase [Alphaproteobacteria bacterium]|nr:3,4-dihydroxy-2-butanone-4-phosphate synthase [Alphaproteobacteria bacterium]
MTLSSIKEVIKDASEGKIFILVDDENRENEGDLCVLGEHATPEAVNFMAKYGRGLICLSLTRSQSELLGLSLMERRNEGRFETAFTVSIEARKGVTTGISAADRSLTIKTAINLNAFNSDITTPGHVFPLIAKDGGTLIRAGHTEAVIDIAKLANSNPSGVICEIMKDNGEMARLPDLTKFAKKHNIKIGSISDLISYRRKNETIIKRVSESILESKFGGDWRIIVFKNIIDDSEHMALVKGIIDSSETTLVRVHALDLLSDVLGDQSSSRDGSELSLAMNTIAKNKNGIIILIRDTSSDTLSKKISQIISKPSSRNHNVRDIGVGAQILLDLGVKNMTVLYNTSTSAIGLDGFGLTIKNWKKLG